MRILTILMCLSMSVCVLAQNKEIYQWQRTYPSVIFMETYDFERIPEEKRELLGDFVIVYEDQINMSDIENFVKVHPQFKLEKQEMSLKDRERASFVKKWSALNGDVKILKRSYFNGLNAEKKAIYLENDALILEGDKITYEDIIRYESKH